MNPIRVQRKRTAGWKMPENTIYVGRPSRWGNPCSPQNGTHIVMHHNKVVSSRPMTIEECVRRFRDDVMDGSIGLSPDEIREHLRGKNLACWCSLNQPCHADVLLEIANQ